MTAATGVYLLGVVLGLGLLGCAARSATPGPDPAPSAAVEQTEDASEEGPVPLTQSERELATELKQHVSWLAGEVGERHLGREWDLAVATDGLVERLESYGHTVERSGVVAGDAVAQNLEVVVRGGKRGTEQVVVGAHYDTHVGSPGADDNASGVAAVLALARRLVGASPVRTLRLVLFCNEELPHFGTESMGSLAYAKRLKSERADVVAMLSLESLGYFSDEPGSQRYPEPIAGRYPDTGNFIAVVGNPESRAVLEQVGAAMAGGSLPVVADTLAEDTPGVGSSDHWSFWRMGYPAVMVTDTVPFRNPHYHGAGDVPATLDYDRMARAVSGVERAVRRLIGLEARS